MQETDFSVKALRTQFLENAKARTAQGLALLDGRWIPAEARKKEIRRRRRRVPWVSLQVLVLLCALFALAALPAGLLWLLAY
jgi:hypothetical protein